MRGALVFVPLLLAGCVGTSTGHFHVLDPPPMASLGAVAVPAHGMIQIHVEGPGWGRLMLRSADDHAQTVPLSIQDLRADPATVLTRGIHFFALLRNHDPTTTHALVTAWDVRDPAMRPPFQKQIALSSEGPLQFVFFTNAERATIRMGPASDALTAVNYTWTLEPRADAVIRRPHVEEGGLSDPLWRVQHSQRFDQRIDAPRHFILGHASWVKRTDGPGTYSFERGELATDGRCVPRDSEGFGPATSSDLRFETQWTEPFRRPNPVDLCARLIDSSVGAADSRALVEYAVMPVE